MRRRASRSRRGEAGDGPIDPGLQIERTWLAWGRTALSFAAVGALLMHIGRSGAGVLGMVPGLAVVACAVVTYAVGRTRHLNMRTAVRTGETVTSPLPLHVVAACAVASTLCGIATIWW